MAANVNECFKRPFMLKKDGRQHGFSIQISINLGKKASPHILHEKNCCDLNLGENLCIVTFFLFSDSGLNLLNGFDFYFDLF